jgi:uncharacterized membrane protein YoaK (UPF0700 family)
MAALALPLRKTMQKSSAFAQGDQRHRPRIEAVILTAVAGAVDAIGYLFLAHVFVANMSGNSVALGLYAAKLDWAQCWHRGFPILMFITGLLVGGTLAETARCRDSAHALTIVLIAEAILLAGFSFLAIVIFGGRTDGALPPRQSGTTDLLVALSALAMGVQNVALRAAGVLSVYTTHVTGTLTQLADKTVKYAQWRWRSHRNDQSPESCRHADTPADHSSARELLFLSSLWTVYVAGALAGAAGLMHWGIAVSLAPLVVISAMILLRIF